MKTLRILGTTLLITVLCLNFTACSDDDDDGVNVNQLEGTWGLVRSAGWELCSNETERDEWDYTCDPYNPSNESDCEKLVIKKLTDNTYSVAVFDYYNSKWQMDGSSQTLTLNGNTLTVSKTNGNYGYFESYANLIIEALTTDKLAIHVKYDNVQTDPEDDPDHRHSVDFTETFTKME